MANEKMMNLTVSQIAESNIPWLDIIGLILFILGYTIGLGSGMGAAVGVFLGSECDHWIQRIVRPHKAAEPFIWVGILIAVLGGAILYRDSGWGGVVSWQALILIILIANNLFLRYQAIPLFHGRLDKPPTLSWQVRVLFSAVLSMLCWATELVLLVWGLLVR